MGSGGNSEAEIRESLREGEYFGGLGLAESATNPEILLAIAKLKASYPNLHSLLNQAQHDLIQDRPGYLRKIGVVRGVKNALARDYGPYTLPFLVEILDPTLWELSPKIGNPPEGEFCVRVKREIFQKALHDVEIPSDAIRSGQWMASAEGSDGRPFDIKFDVPREAKVGWITKGVAANGNETIFARIKSIARSPVPTATAYRKALPPAAARSDLWDDGGNDTVEVRLPDGNRLTLPRHEAEALIEILKCSPGLFDDVTAKKTWHEKLRRWIDRMLK